MPSSLTATWVHLTTSTRLQRSSQSLSVLDSQAYIFGGEVKPREPVDNQIDIVSIKSDGQATASTLPALSTAPSPRVGTVSAALDSGIYLFSGRGGVAMAPIDEKGAVWKYTPESETWTLLAPSDPSATYPQARSYHAMTSANPSTLYLHAGCPESGRLSDLWSFDISSRTWKKLAAAPDPPRGGTSVAWANGKLWRMNGFDGKTEQGGAVDIYDPSQDKWSTIPFTADNVQGPGPRSVGVLVPVTWDERRLLLTMFGEQDPSALGHAGAGKMKSDVWAFDIGSQEWSKVDTKGEAEPDARGWFAADVTRLDGNDVAIVHGGLAEGNNRLGDVWALRHD